MKKLIFLAAGLVLAGAANAQIAFGVKGGLDVSNIIKTNDPNYATNYKTGFNAGITLDVHLVGPLTLAPELLYAQKGFSTQTTYGKFDQRTNFIDVPILAKIKLAQGFNVVVGPEISFLTSTTNTYDSGFSTVVQKQYEDDANKFRKNLIDGVIGVSFDLSKSVDIHGRYSLDLQKNNQDGTSQTPQYRNQVWQIGLGVRFE